MKKGKKFKKIINIASWIIIAIALISIIILSNSDIIFEDNISESSILVISAYIMLIGIIMIIITIFGCLLIIPRLIFIFIGKKAATRKYNKQKLEKIDFKNDNYYRNLLPKYSIAVLSYLDNFKIDKEEIVATLLILELKRKIKIQDKEIIVIDDTTENLKEDEIYVLDNLKNKTLKNINIDDFAKIVKKEAYKEGVVEENKDLSISILKKIEIIGIISIMCFFIPFFVDINSVVMIFLSFIGYAIFGGGMCFIVAYIIKYILLTAHDPYVRSNEGKEINTKLEGLRKFLIDFSTIKEKTKEELILWEEYLVYSVILGINKKIVDETYKKI